MLNPFRQWFCNHQWTWLAVAYPKVSTEIPLAMCMECKTFKWGIQSGSVFACHKPIMDEHLRIAPSHKSMIVIYRNPSGLNSWETGKCVDCGVETRYWLTSKEALCIACAEKRPTESEGI